MATRTWQNSNDSSFANDATHWGSALIAADTGHMPVNDYDRTTNLTALGALALADFYIGHQVRKSLGTSSQSVTFGACTGRLQIDAPLADAIYLAPVSIPLVAVRASSQNPDAVKLTGGTLTEVVVRTEGRVKIGSGATVTRLQVNQGLVYIENGATITDIEQTGGVIEDYAGFSGSGYFGGGIYKALGDNTLTIGTMNCEGNSQQIIISQCTITYIKQRAPGGLFDLTRDSRLKTITNAYTMAGVIDARNSGLITFSSSPVEKGGLILGATTKVAHIEGGGGPGPTL